MWIKLSFIFLIALSFSGLVLAEHTSYSSRNKIKAKPPIFYSSDIWSPHGDLDDHFDLVTLLSLDHLDLKVIVIDNTMETNVLRTRVDKLPNYPAIELASNLFKRKVPVRAGLKQPLKSTFDDGRSASKELQKGIELIIEELNKAEDQSAIFIATGSLRDFAAAYNREPDLFKRKVKKMILSIGDSYGVAGVTDTNTAKDVEAWKRIMTSGLPIYWLPTNPSKQRGGPSRYVSYWYFPQNRLLKHSSEGIRNFFEKEGIQVDSEVARHMWSTPAFIESAGLTCYEVQENFKWMTAEEAKGISGATPCNPYEFVPIHLSLNEEGAAVWKEAGSSEKSNISIIRINDYYLYHETMFQFLQQQFN